MFTFMTLRLTSSKLAQVKRGGFLNGRATDVYKYSSGYRTGHGF